MDASSSLLIMHVLILKANRGIVKRGRVEQTPLEPTQ
jgi:hypothetical protein